MTRSRKPKPARRAAKRGARPPATARSGKRVAASKRAVRGTRAAGAVAAELKDVETLRAEIARVARTGGPARWNANPEEVRRAVMKLVLTLVELIRRLLERQAIRRMEEGTLTAGETEAVGQALMRLDETVRELAAQFDLSPGDLNLDLGPIGRLM